MLLLGLCFLLSQYTIALPLPPSQSLLSIRPSEVPIECPTKNSRSTVEIVWSCVATMFACTWVAVHPNIPGSKEEWYIIARRRLKLMFWAVVAPEMIIFWAMRQWVNAKKIAEIYEGQSLILESEGVLPLRGLLTDKNWTKAHGFLLQMGGFVLYDGKSSLGPLSLVRFRELLERDEIDFPDITVAQIQDRSKGDLLAKGVVAVQTFWFGVQCIARGIQGIGITELELVTLAFAVLNGIMYFFWWDKPLDVRCPIVIHLKAKEARVYEELASEMITKHATESSPLEVAGEQKWLGNQEIVEGLEIEMIQLNAAEEELTEGLQQEYLAEGNSPAAPSIPAFEKDITVEETKTMRWTKYLRNIPHQVWSILQAIITAVLVDVLRPLDDMTQSPTSITIAPGSTRVPTFYAELAGPTVLYGLDMPSAVMSVVFGAIHCIGLLPHFKFPSAVERTLWRTCSILITTIPVPFLLLSIMLYCKVHWRPPGIGRTLFHIFKRVIYISLVFYIVARLALLVQAFVSLRSLPDDAHIAVDWTTFLPHVL